MPDEDQLFLQPAAAPPPVERRRNDSSHEFLMGQLARLPTRRELAWLALVILFVGAMIGIVGIEAFRRYVPRCILNPANPLPSTW
jgi:hypothetical protein